MKPLALPLSQTDQAAFTSLCGVAAKVCSALTRRKVGMLAALPSSGLHQFISDSIRRPGYAVRLRAATIRIVVAPACSGKSGDAAVPAWGG